MPRKAKAKPTVTVTGKLTHDAPVEPLSQHGEYPLHAHVPVPEMNPTSWGKLRPGEPSREIRQRLLIRVLTSYPYPTLRQAAIMVDIPVQTARHWQNHDPEFRERLNAAIDELDSEMLRLVKGGLRKMALKALKAKERNLMSRDPAVRERASTWVLENLFKLQPGASEEQKLKVEHSFTDAIAAISRFGAEHGVDLPPELQVIDVDTGDPGLEEIEQEQYLEAAQRLAERKMLGSGDKTPDETFWADSDYGPDDDADEDDEIDEIDEIDEMPVG